MCQFFALSQTQTFLQQNRNRAFNHHFMRNCAPHAFVSQSFSLILIRNGKNVNVTAPRYFIIRCSFLTYYLTSDSIIKFDSCLISPNCRGMMDGWSFEASRVIRSIINNLPASTVVTRQRARMANMAMTIITELRDYLRCFISISC